jgi:hypothetical protein
MRQTCGIALIASGIAGILLPVIPGIPLLAAGVALLGTDHALVRPCLTWLRKRGILREAHGAGRSESRKSPTGKPPEEGPGAEPPAKQ